MPRRTSSRLRQLREHLTRTRWRDDQAIAAYRTLLDAQKPGKSFVDLAVFDAVLKDHYKEQDIALMAYAENAMLRFFRGHHGEGSLPHVRYAAGDRLHGRATGLDGYIPMVDDRDAQETERAGNLSGERQEGMTRIVDEDVIRQKPVSDAYRDGWERCFGDVDRNEEPKPLCEAKPGEETFIPLEIKCPSCGRMCVPDRRSVSCMCTECYEM